jgi:hypothetical protein
MIYLNLDMSEVLGLINMKGAVEQAVNDAARDLAQMTAAKITDLARQKLKSRYQMYIDGLTTFEAEKDVWVVNLSSKVRFIEDGQEAFNMLDGLLKSSKAKTSKDGSKYVMVPFEHGPGKGPTAEGGASGQANQDLISTIKAEMKRRKIPFGKIEKGAGGAPLTGKLHSFDINDAPLKTSEGPGQGWGPLNDIRQGPNARQLVGGGPGGGGTPFLQGVNVYQTPYTDKKGNQAVRRSIVTFRTASSKQKGSGLWDHPGNEPLNLMEEGLAWARQEWETSISPEILDKIYTSLD